MRYYGLLLLLLAGCVLLVSAQSNPLDDFKNSHVIVVYDNPEQPTRIYWYEVLQRYNAKRHQTKTIYVLAERDSRDAPSLDANLLRCYSTQDNEPINSAFDAFPAIGLPPEEETERVMGQIQSNITFFQTILAQAGTTCADTTTAYTGQSEKTLNQCALPQVSAGHVDGIPRDATIQAGQKLMQAGGDLAGYSGVRFVGDSGAEIRYSLIPDPKWLPFFCQPQGLTFPSDASNITSVSIMQFHYSTSQPEQVIPYFQSQLTDWSLATPEASDKALFTRKKDDDMFECRLELTIQNGNVYGNGGWRLLNASNPETIQMGPVSTLIPNSTVAIEMEKIRNNPDYRIENEEYTLQNDQRGFLATTTTTPDGKQIEQFHTFYQQGDFVRYLVDNRPGNCTLDQNN